MIGTQGRGGEPGPPTLMQSDILLDLLGGRMASGISDPAVALLRALTDDVDLVPGQWPHSTATVTSPQGVVLRLPTVARRRHTARGTALAVVVAATLSVSGVAAAVTGDPLTPYRAVLSFGADDRRPSPAVLAGLRAGLAAAGAAASAGDRPAARSSVARLQDRLDGMVLADGQRRRFERALQAVEASLARATRAPADAPVGTVRSPDMPSADVKAAHLARLVPRERAKVATDGTAAGGVATDRSATDRKATDRKATDPKATDRKASDPKATDRKVTDGRGDQPRDPKAGPPVEDSKPDPAKAERAKPASPSTRTR